MRRIVIGIALLYLAIASILLVLGLGNLVVIWSVFEGGILLAAILFERWRYRPRVDRRRGNWQPTGERFLDPGTGQLMEVFYNPDTGERDYVEIGHKMS